MAANLLASIELCATAATLLADKSIALLQANPAHMRDLAMRSPSLVTALAPAIGYDRAALIAKSMVANGLTIEQATRRELGDSAWEQLAGDVSLERMAYPHTDDPGGRHDPSGP